MIKTIYAIKNCVKCERAKIMFPDAECIGLFDIADDEQKKILDECNRVGQKSAPILINEFGNIVFHDEVGL